MEQKDYSGRVSLSLVFSYFLASLLRTTQGLACAMDLSLGLMLVLTLALDIARTPTLHPSSEAQSENEH
jgi:hypothetical protein